MDRSLSETTVVVTEQEHAADTIVKVDVLEIGTTSPIVEAAGRCHIWCHGSC